MDAPPATGGVKKEGEWGSEKKGKTWQQGVGRPRSFSGERNAAADHKKETDGGWLIERRLE